LPPLGRTRRRGNSFRDIVHGTKNLLRNIVIATANCEPPAAVA
jgi:hypothetical protein